MRVDLGDQSKAALFVGPPTIGLTLIILGLILFLIGLLASIPILQTIGIVLAVVGLILLLVGRSGRKIGGRSHWF